MGKDYVKRRDRSDSSGSSDSDRKKPKKSSLLEKRSNQDRLIQEAKRERDAIRAQSRREMVREHRMERAGIKKSK